LSINLEMAFCNGLGWGCVEVKKDYLRLICDEHAIKISDQL